MLFARCDECCDILEDIDGGIVYECDYEVNEKYQLWHICDECLESSDDLVLYSDGVLELVKTKD